MPHSCHSSDSHRKKRPLRSELCDFMPKKSSKNDLKGRFLESRSAVWPKNRRAHAPERTRYPSHVLVAPRTPWASLARPRRRHTEAPTPLWHQRAAPTSTRHPARPSRPNVSRRGGRAGCEAWRPSAAAPHAAAPGARHGVQAPPPRPTRRRARTRRRQVPARSGREASRGRRIRRVP